MPSSTPPRFTGPIQSPPTSAAPATDVAHALDDAQGVDAPHGREPDELFDTLGSSREHGLAAKEAARRLAAAGPNVIESTRRRTLPRVVLAQLTDSMIVVLLAAAVVSGLVGDLQDTIAILVIVALNATIGALQELRAERAVAALRRLSAPRAKVLRDGVLRSVPAEELVSGDVLHVEAGDVVGADARVIEAARLQLDEAPLTGESVAVRKSPESLEVEPGAGRVPLGDRANMLHRGTSVTGGHGVGLVVTTGMRTELGRIAGLLHEAAPARAPLQIRLARLGRTLGLCVLAICAVVFVAGIARGEGTLLMFLTALSLAVAAIPEAMPAVVSVSLALGAKQMSGRNALVRRLSAVETLGSVTTIASDKTGTLTRGRMRVEVLLAGGERRASLPRADASDDGRPAPDVWTSLARAMALNADVEVHGEEGSAREEPELSGDPTEVALVAATFSSGCMPRARSRALPRVAEVPFDTDRRRMTTVHRAAACPEHLVAFVKGAPEAVLECCSDELTASGTAPLDRDLRAAEADALAAEGYRVLGFALRRLPADSELDVDPEHLESQLSFLGFAGLLDPPRDEAEAAVRSCRNAGIRPVMITGDHPGTALAIARRLGIAETGDAALTGAELQRLSATTEPEATAERIASTAVFARVSPEQKLDIVRALQARGEFVAMTGDGVNDAPALQRAEIGVAMGQSGTEVAREAAEMVLLDDDFSTIVAAVREGRRVFDNIRKFVQYTLTSNCGEIWTLFLAPFLGLPLPLLPIQILWINLVTDGLPGLALAAEPEEPGVMRRLPRSPRESLFARGLGWHVGWMGLFIAGLSIGAQAWAIRRGSENWQSVVFTVLTLSQLVHALGSRSERQSTFTLPLFTNPALLGALVLTLGLQFAVLYLPVAQGIFGTAALSRAELVPCLALPLLVLVAMELEKWLARRGLIYGERSPS